MKKIMFSVLFCTGAFFAAFSQAPGCPSTFVRDFQTADGQQTELTRMLTDDLENLLLNNNCIVLLRADYPGLAERLNALQKLTAAAELRDALRTELTSTNALQLISGTVSPDNGGNARVTIRIFDLSGNRDPKIKTMQFSDIELKKAEYREAKLAQLIDVAASAPGSPSIAPAPEDISSPDDREEETTQASGGNTNTPEAGDKEVMLWQQIAKKPSENNVRAYLVQYPEGLYMDKIESLVWGECVATERSGKCKNYLKLFPDGAYAEQAQQILAGNKGEIISYLPDPGMVLAALPVDGNPKNTKPGEKNGQGKASTAPKVLPVSPGREKDRHDNLATTPEQGGKKITKPVEPPKQSKPGSSKPKPVKPPKQSKPDSSKPKPVEPPKQSKPGSGKAKPVETPKQSKPGTGKPTQEKSKAGSEVHPKPIKPVKKGK